MNTDAQVLVGYDGKPDALAALSWAAKVASLRGEGVVAVTIIDPRATPRGVAWPASYWEDIDDTARAVLAEWPEVPSHLERHVGHVVPTLVEYAAHASLLVVGSHGHSLVGEILRGSVSQSTARHAAVPVVVVRPPFNADSGRIVVGADGSDSSGRALDFACRMARLTGDKVVVLGAWHQAPVAADRYGYLPPTDADSIEDAEAVLGRRVDELREAHPDVPIEAEVFHGAAERGLQDASDNAAMVVVGSRGRTAVAGAFLGSVSQAVLHKAHCPVAVVH